LTLRIDFAYGRRAEKLNMQYSDLAPATAIPPHLSTSARAATKAQSPCVVWLTGLSGAGKSTIAGLLDLSLHASGRHTTVLDGDALRRGLNRDLGFSLHERSENVRRIAEVAALMADAGLIVIVSVISPLRADRACAREALRGHAHFIEVFVDVPLEVAERRDPKGLYRRARAGMLPQFTGIGSPYEAPADPDIHLDAATLLPAQSVALIRHRIDALIDPAAAHERACEAEIDR
jgi:bifunctional enzyme CysN/CysC